MNVQAELEKHVPMIWLETFWKENKLQMYDTERNTIVKQKIKDSQPKWESPKWSNEVQLKLDQFLTDFPTDKIAVERWLVRKLFGLQLYKQWYHKKHKEVEKLIQTNTGLLYRNLLTIRKVPKFLPSKFSIANTLIRKITEFCDEHKLKEQHVYKDIRQYCLEKYGDASTQVLISFQDISSDSSDPPETEEPIEYKELRDMFTMEQIAYKSQSETD